MSRAGTQSASDRSGNLPIGKILYANMATSGFTECVQSDFFGEFPAAYQLTQEERSGV